MLFLCLVKEIWYTFYLRLETTPLCDDNHLPSVPQWKCHNSNGEHKWTGEEGIRVKQSDEWHRYQTIITVNEICLPFSTVFAKAYVLLQVMSMFVFWYQKLIIVHAIVGTSKEQANGLL